MNTICGTLTTYCIVLLVVLNILWIFLTNSTSCCHFTIFWIYYVHNPGVNSASNRNEYREYFLGVKAAGEQGWYPYYLHVPIVLKSGSLHLLEPLGPVQAFNGIAFAFMCIITRSNWIIFFSEIYKLLRYCLTVLWFFSINWWMQNNWSVIFMEAILLCLLLNKPHLLSLIQHRSIKPQPLFNSLDSCKCIWYKS